MQNIDTAELFPLRNSSYKLATLQKWGQKDSGQYSVYNPPTSNLDLLRTRGDKYETHPHPTGQRWGNKVRQNYENHQ